MAADGFEMITSVHEEGDRSAASTIPVPHPSESNRIRRELQANCSLKKPEAWEAFEKFVRSLNDFWITHAILPGYREGERNSRRESARS